MADRLKIEQVCDKGIMNVACALVSMQAYEFLHAYRGYLKDPSDEIIADQYNSICKELSSDYFHELTGLNGNKIMESLRFMVSREMRQCA